MQEYELVREVKNLCPNNQMRDVFFLEVQTEDPVAYVREYLKGKAQEITAEYGADGTVTVTAGRDGLIQCFRFSPL